MKLLPKFIILSGVIFFFSCSKKGDGCITKRTSVYLDSLLINPTAQSRLDNNTGNRTFSYNGVEIRLEFQSYRKINFITNPLSEEQGECSRTDYMVNSDKEERVSKSSDLPITIVETRYKPVSGYEDTSSLRKTQELIEVFVNQHLYSIPIDSTDTLSGKFLLNIKLGKNDYDSVYQCYRKNISYNDNDKTVVYYKFGTGVLAFSINENELWVKK